MDRALWPLDDLVLTTPRLELRPDDDAGVRELVELAHHGVHPPEQMPFLVPWTDANPAELGSRRFSSTGSSVRRSAHKTGPFSSWSVGTAG